MPISRQWAYIMFTTFVYLGFKKSKVYKGKKRKSFRTHRDRAWVLPGFVVLE